MKNLKSRLFLRGADMVREVLMRSWRNRERSIEVDPPGSSDPSKSTVDEGQPANDNGKTWPLVPFPDGWFGG
jgi:hypothetical protein